ncbi:hypothetical protein C7999DRAFT_38283 [Corynascus novoguineensis]|uniref:Ankyrin repeat protein n=1 Tax=Corynascus novoguineensis TaxID=1126955 RepID=A0AAN7CYP2_9PEZI|nr:hypothetical protein C7999DRAFT_38283 [Corynascus novoguineensis]
MADPLSIPGSVVGIISLGLQVTQYLFDYYSALKNRETHLSGTITKLEQLMKVLEVVRTQAEARRSKPDEDNQFGNILTAVQRCEECIQELKEEADKFRESPTQARRFGAAARATVRRIVYPLRRSTLQRIEEGIDEILTHLSVAQLSWIQKELDEIRYDVEDTKALLEQMRANQVSSEIRKWLNAPDATTNLNIACANKHPGTGLWFVQGTRFSDWLRVPNSFLWVCGFAGSGKSVLCSTAIQHTYRHIQRRPSAGLAFFYFSFSDSGKQNVESLLRALILQLSSQLQKGSQLLALYQRHHAGTPPYQDLLSCLSEIIRDFTDVYLVIDALDESPRSLSRDAVLQALAEIRAWSDPKLHLLVTSRDEADIREELHANQDEIVVMKNDSIDRDIALFVSQHLRQNRRLRKWERHHDRIEKAFTERAKGVFRWVECQFRALASCPRSEDLLEQLLQSLPATLDETYRRMLLNIPPASAPYAHQILSLLCCSERPLKVAELLDAVAVELGGQSQVFKYNPKRRLEDEQAILEVCPGFTELSVDPRTGETTVRIAHFSVQEYLESERLRKEDVKAFSIERTKAHTKMAHICLTFLLDPKLAFSVEKYPFVSYAAHWPHHFRGSSAVESVEARVLQLFQGPQWLFLNWVHLWRTSLVFGNLLIRGMMPCWDALLPLYYASRLGLPSIICKLLDQRPPSAIGSADSVAAATGSKELVQVFLENGTDVNGRDDRGRAALSIAAQFDYRELVPVLLEAGADINAQDNVKRTPLLIAFEKDHQSTISEQLIKAGADINLPDKYGASTRRRLKT